jgi:hypothetical protein
MVSLYKLTDQQRELKEMAGNSDLPAEAFADTFEALEGQFNDKAVSVIHVVKNMDSDVDALDAEIKRLTDRKKVIKNKQESIREYLRSNMEANEITKIDCPLFSITLAKGRDVAVIFDESLLPDDYVEVSVIEKPNKAAILKALKADEQIPGARIEKSKTSLRIK